VVYLFDINRWVMKEGLVKGLSRMMGNYHVRFLGGRRVVRPWATRCFICRPL